MPSDAGDPRGLDLRILGPFQLFRDGLPTPVDGVKPRQLLATLALRHNRNVSVDHLIEVLWPAGPPRSARANVHTYVSGLRTLLGEERLCRQSSGYRLRISPVELDAARFEEWANDPDPSAELLDRTLALWRGDPVEDLPCSPQWSAEVRRLQERRRAVRCARARQRIERGEAREALADLRALVEEDPLHEEAWLLLLTALGTAGRRADALAAYASARRIFVEELGVEPGEPLRRLHQTLLVPDAGSPVWADVAGLDADATLVLRCLACLDLGPTPGWVAAAVLDRDAAPRVLDDLQRARLLRRTAIDAAGQERFALPALIGLLVPDLALAPELATDPAGPAATRVLAGYLALAERAARTLPVQVFGPGWTVVPRWQPPDGELAERDPVTWFAAEREALISAVELAARTRRAALAWELAHALVPWCDLGGHTADWERTHRSALAACREAGDLLGEAVTLRGLGQLHLYRDDYGPAVEAFGRARLLFARVNCECGEAGALAGLGAVHRLRGELVAAHECLAQSLASYAALGDRHGEAYARGAIGRLLLDRGELTGAWTSFEAGLAVAREVGDRHRVAHLTHRLGVVRLRQGDVSTARRWLAEALEGFTALGDAHGAAYCLTDLAEVEPDAAAVERLTRSLDIFERIGDRRAQAQTARRLGELYQDAGRSGLSDAYLAEAHRLWSALEQRAG